MSQAGVLTVNTSGGSVVETLTGNSGGAVGPDASFNINILGNNSTGINIVGSPGTNTLSVVGIQATTLQRGTVFLATNAQAIAGTDNVNALTSSNLAAKLGTQTAHSLAVFEGSSSALTALGAATNGQLPIGSTGADPVLGNITSSGGTITVTNGAGTINLDVAASSHVVETLTGNSGGAISPTAGNINTLGTGSITIAGAGSTLTTQLTGLTNHNVLVGAGTSTITKVAPSATSGVPLISQGAAADPAFGTAVVAGGGTGATSFTAFAPVCGGTTTTGVLQSANTGIATSGWVLTSTGAASLPTWQVTASMGVTTIDGDTGSATGGTITFHSTPNSGSTTSFDASGSTVNFNVTDSILDNTIMGFQAGNGTISGIENTGFGKGCLKNTTGGSANVAVGWKTLEKITNDNYNVAIGSQALQVLVGSTGHNTAVGTASLAQLVTGNSNTCVGYLAGLNYVGSETNNILIGANVQGTASESTVTRIGNTGTQTACYIDGIAGVSVSNLNIVTINTSTGQLGSQAAANVGTVTQYDVLVGGAAGAIASVGPGSSGQVLQSAGNAANPSYSTATYPATATGTGTILRANGTNWVATTATYPTTTTSQQLLYSTGNSVVGELTTANSKLPATNSSGTLAMRAFSVNIQTFTSAGTYTPTSGMLYCIIECVGNGGGGGGTATAAAATLSGGAGGGGGGYSRKFASATTVGASQSVTFGATGAGGTSGNNAGTSGGDVAVGTICVGKGGTGGGGNSGSGTATGGAGGVAGTGDFSVPGGVGQVFIAGTPTTIFDGRGGSAALGFGAGGQLQSNSTPQTGAAATNYGGGGSGGISYSANGAAAGGAGTTGLVVITEYVIA